MRDKGNVLQFHQFRINPCKVSICLLIFPSGDVFFVGDGDEDSGIGFDLSVLAHSNHTVMSRGTFSMWGAILCGGEQYSEYGTIVPTSLQE